MSVDLSKLNELPIEIRNQLNYVLEENVNDVTADIATITDSLADVTADVAILNDMDIAVLDEAQAYTKHQRSTPVALTYAATVAVDASLSNVFTLTLTDTTAMLGNPTNLAAGQSFMVVVTQDGTGGRALTFDTKYSFGAAGAPNLAASLLNIVDVITCYVVSTTKIACTVLRGF